MLSTLPIKKIYVDTHYMLPSSHSTSDFTIDLENTIQLPDNATFYISEIHIPTSWYSIETDYNDKLYIRYLFSDNSYIDKIVQLPRKSHDGDSLGKDLDTYLKLNYRDPNTEPFQVLYIEDINSIQITPIAPGLRFKLFSDEELQMDIGWNGTHYNKNDLQSVNNVLRNRKITPIYSLASPYMSQFLNLLNINTIYITSPDLGSYSTLGPRPGELTVIKKKSGFR